MRGGGQTTITLHFVLQRERKRERTSNYGVAKKKKKRVFLSTYFSNFHSCLFLCVLVMLEYLSMGGEKIIILRFFFFFLFNTTL